MMQNRQAELQLIKRTATSGETFPAWVDYPEAATWIEFARNLSRNKAMAFYLGVSFYTKYRQTPQVLSGRVAGYFFRNVRPVIDKHLTDRESYK